MKKAIFIVDYFFPGYQGGGPPHSVYRLAKALKDFMDVTVVTHNHDKLNKKPYADLPVLSLTEYKGVKVIYLKKPSLHGLYKVVRDISPEIIYCASLFCRFTICCTILCRFCFRNIFIIITPRGELGGGALRIKWLKKRIYLMLMKKIGMYDNVLFHATSDFEKKDIEKCFEQPIRIIENLTDRERFASVVPVGKEERHLRLVFISRINRKKNLHYALQVLNMGSWSGHIEMDIYGPKDDKQYWGECERLIGNMPESVKVNYRGEVIPREMPSVMGQYHLLFLPTANENFGHVIVESLSAGMPVLISDQTPWQGLQDKGIGWSLPLEKPERFVEALEAALSMSAEPFRALSDRARNWEKNRITSAQIIDAYKKMFDDCC